MSGPDDVDLVARFAAGDEGAVRDLYARYSGPVFTVAMSRLGRRDLAPWLYAIARRVAIDIHRRESRAAVPAQLADDDVAVEPVSLSRTWQAWEVRAAVDKLPAPERDVVRLGHLEGLTHREIADHLGIPVGTVKSRSARAHRRLAALLGHLVVVPR